MRDNARAGRDTEDNIRAGKLPKQEQRRNKKATRAGGMVEWKKGQQRRAAPSESRSSRGAPRRNREEMQEDVQL